jgi:hypothetical protein
VLDTAAGALETEAAPRAALAKTPGAVRTGIDIRRGASSTTTGPPW